MNRYIKDRKFLKPGVKLKGMLTAIAGNGHYFKLNCGIRGLISGAERIGKLYNATLGDVIDCVVIGYTPLKDSLLLDAL
jgi:hypothetical protein